VTLVFAMAVGGVLDARAYRTILFPMNPPPLSWDVAIGVLGIIQSIIIDTILLIRLVVVYPKPYLGPTRFYLLIMLPILLKAARIGNLIAFIKVLADNTKDPLTADLLIAKVWVNAPYLKIEWFCQLFDNSYASGFFLLRLGMRNRAQAKVDSRNSTSAFTQKIKGLMYIAITNFVFPVLFSLVQIIIVYREVNLAVVNDVVFVNTSIAVIGVVFATVWAGSGNRHGSQMDSPSDKRNPTSGGSPSKQELSTIIFNSRGVVSTQGDNNASMQQHELWEGVVSEPEESSPSMSQNDKTSFHGSISAV